VIDSSMRILLQSVLLVKLELFKFIPITDLISSIFRESQESAFVFVECAVNINMYAYGFMKIYENYVNGYSIVLNDICWSILND